MPQRQRRQRKRLRRQKIQPPHRIIRRRRRKRRREYADVEQQQPRDNEHRRQRRSPAFPPRVVGQQYRQRDEKGQEQLRPENPQVGIEHQIPQYRRLHLQPSVPVGNEKREQMVGMQQRQPQQHLARRPERRPPDILPVAPPPPQRIRHQQNQRQPALETDHRVKRRQDGILPPRYHRHRKIADDEKLHEHHQHKVERPQYRQAALLYLPLPLAPLPAPGQPPVQRRPDPRRRPPALRHIRHRRHPQDPQRTHRHPHHRRHQPPRRVHQLLKPYRPPRHRLPAFRHHPDFRQRNQCRYEQQDVDHARHRKQLRDPRQRPPPVALREPERARRQRRRRRHRKNESEGCHIKPPVLVVSEPGRRRLAHKARHAQYRQPQPRPQQKPQQRRLAPLPLQHARHHPLPLGNDPHLRPEMPVLAVPAIVRPRRPGGFLLRLPARVRPVRLRFPCHQCPTLPSGGYSSIFFR